MPPGSNSQDIRLAIVEGPRSDTNAQVVPVRDINNMVRSPDGTDLECRGGLEIRQHFNIDMTNVPAGKLVIVKDSGPPDVDLGNEYLVLDPSGPVDDINFMRDRTQQQGAMISSNVSFVESNIIAPQFVDNTYFYNITRGGDISTRQTVRARTQNGTFDINATGGAFDYEVDFDPGETTKQLGGDVIGDRSGDPTDFFLIELYAPSEGMSISGSTTLTVTRLT